MNNNPQLNKSTFKISWVFYLISLFFFILFIVAVYSRSGHMRFGNPEHMLNTSNMEWNEKHQSYIMNGIPNIPLPRAFNSRPEITDIDAAWFIVSEDGIPLQRVTSSSTGNTIPLPAGCFQMCKAIPKNAVLYFTASDNGDPRSNGCTYTLTYVWICRIRWLVLALVASLICLIYGIYRRHSPPLGIYEYWQEMALGVVVIGVFILWFYQWNFEPYWADEVWSAIISDPSRRLMEVVKITIDDVHPPLYQMILWCSYKLLGYSEFTGRLISICASIASVVAIYYLYLEIIPNGYSHRKTGALFSAMLICVNIVVYRYSLECRSYAMMILLTILSSLYFLRTFSDVRFSWKYVLSSAALVSTHFFGVLVIAAHVFFYLQYYFHARINKYRVAFNYKLISSYSLIFLPLLLIYNSIRKNLGRPRFWIGKPDPEFYIEYFNWYFGSSSLGFLVIILIISSIFKMKTRITNSSERLLLCPIVIISIFMVGYLRSIVSVPILTSRNSLGVLPFIIILFAFSVTRIKFFKMRWVMVLIVLALSMNILFVSQGIWSVSHKSSLRALLNENLDVIENRRIYYDKGKKFVKLYSQWLYGERFFCEQILPLEPINKISSLESGQAFAVFSYPHLGKNEKDLCLAIEKQKSIVLEKVISKTNREFLIIGKVK